MRENIKGLATLRPVVSPGRTLPRNVASGLEKPMLAGKGLATWFKETEI